jgi:hypothetical protein
MTPDQRLALIRLRQDTATEADPTSERTALAVMSSLRIRPSP